MARTAPQMAEDLRRVRVTIEPQFETVSRIDERLVRMQNDLLGLRETIERLERTAETLAGKVPDPGGPGPIARARDAIAST